MLNISGRRDIVLNISGRRDNKPLQDDEMESLPCFPLDEVYTFKAVPQGMQKEIVGLYHNINAQRSDVSIKTIQFIASQPGSGTSTITREFARFLYEKLNKSVYLLDANTHYSQGNNIVIINNIAIIQRERQIQPVVASHNATIKTVYERGKPLSVVCPISSLTSMFNSPCIDQYMQNLRQYFDYVLIDSPSISTSKDGLASAQKVDGVVLIVDSESTRYPAAENAKHAILKAGGHIIGVILNKRKCYIPGFIYRKFFK